MQNGTLKRSATGATLIADSGSTKTHWGILTADGNLKEFTTPGINPYYQSYEDICYLLEQQLFCHFKATEISHIYFYGAGCAAADKKQILHTAFKLYCSNASIEIESDLLGAARAMFQDSPGIIGILGTGSNSGVYNGYQIIENVSPLGFILGDEGSGAVIAKQFVADCLKNQAPVLLSQSFFERFQLSREAILEHVYRLPFPNRYLAQFMPFLSEYKHEDYVSDLIREAFIAYAVRNLKQYNYESYPIRIVGSVAYHFATILRDALIDTGLYLDAVEADPIAKLIMYHHKQHINQ